MLSVILLCICLIGSARSMCYKYEPLYSNWTGTTSLSVVKIPTQDICRKAAQCSWQEGMSDTSLEICPIEIVKPQPAPTISYGEGKTFFLDEFRFEELKVSKAESSSTQSSANKPPKNRKDDIQKQDKGSSIFTAMCFLADDWSNVCPRDQNVTNQESVPVSQPTPVHHCYVMQRHTVRDDGVCNITLTPKDIFAEFKDEELAGEIRSNRHLMVFHLKPLDEKCFISNSTALTPAEVDRCFPEDEIAETVVFDANEPTCDLKTPQNETLHFEYSLRSLFAGNFMQCHSP